MDTQSSNMLPYYTPLEVEAIADPVLVNDKRVLLNMLREEKDSGLVDYCDGMQTEIKPHMRKIVVDWVLEVCEDAGCQGGAVYHLAVNYLDRYLSRMETPKKYFQSVAAGCLLLASKMVEVSPLRSEQICLYTDHSVSVDQLRAWEMKILNVLQWHLTPPTLHSFIDHLAVGAPQRARRHADILAATAVTEYKFLLMRPSLMAAAALSAACRGLNLPYDVPAVVLDGHAEQIDILVQHLEYVINSYTSTISTPQQSSNTPKQYQQTTPQSDGQLTPTDCHQVSASLDSFSSTLSSLSSTSSSSSYLSESCAKLPPFRTFYQTPALCT